MSLDDKSGSSTMNPILSQIDQEVLSEYVKSQVQAAIEAQARAQAPAPDQTQIIAILQQLAQNTSDSNTTARQNLEAQSLREANKPNRHEKIGTTPSKFKGERSDTECFLTGLEWYFEANASVYDTNEKVLSLVYGLCEGKAGEWVQPYMRNTLDAKLYKSRKEAPRRGRTHHARAQSHDSYSSPSDDSEDEDMKKMFLQDPDFLIIRVRTQVQRSMVPDRSQGRRQEQDRGHIPRKQHRIQIRKQVQRNSHCHRIFQTGSS